MDRGSWVWPCGKAIYHGTKPLPMQSARELVPQGSLFQLSMLPWWCWLLFLNHFIFCRCYRFHFWLEFEGPMTKCSRVMGRELMEFVSSDTSNIFKMGAGSGVKCIFSQRMFPGRSLGMTTAETASIGSDPIAGTTKKLIHNCFLSNRWLHGERGKPNVTSKTWYSLAQVTLGTPTYNWLTWLIFYCQLLG